MSGNPTKELNQAQLLTQCDATSSGKAVIFRDSQHLVKVRERLWQCSDVKH